MGYINKRIYPGGARVGADPEGFFVRNGEVVSSKEILPEEPIVYKDAKGYERGRVVRDGFQLEIQPLSSHCRANAGNFIQCALIALKEYLDKTHPDVQVKFLRTAEIPEAYFNSMTEQERELGCLPSFNLYRPATLDVDPLTYRQRSCGGHLHLGQLPFECDKDHPEFAKRLVKLLDAIVGNTCVLIDRDPGNAIRREVYGRAGEYRLPKWGLEYRTLSNFWLHAYPLQSLVYALARQAAGVLNHSLKYSAYDNGYNPEEDLLSKIDMKKVVRAINTNDLALAQENWAVVKPLLQEWFACGEGLNIATIDDFEFFAKKVQEHGLEYWWPEDSFKHWVEKEEGHGHGWESFIGGPVFNKRYAEGQAKDKEIAIAS